MKRKDSILIVIAARGGSKGLKNKNIRLLAGKPLIAYTVEQAVNWGKADDIVCSTDSLDIANVARKSAAKVPFLRPKSLSGDCMAKIPVIRHAFVTCEKIYEKKYDIVVDLDVTAPVRKITDLDNCLKLFRKRRPETLFSVIKSRKNPYFNMVEEKADGTVALCKKPNKLVSARQNAPKVFDANASIYFYSRGFLMDKSKNGVVSDKSIVYVMDEISGFDIDSEIDFNFVEFLIKKGV